MKNDSILSFPFLPELEDQAQLTQVSLELPDKLTVAEWEHIGRGLGKLDQATQWWVGDWWAFGENQQYGKRKAIVESEDWTGPAYVTCQHAATVCRAFRETCRRRHVLNFSHHLEVSKLDPDLADSLLDWCEAPLKNGSKKVKSVRQLQEEIVSRHNDVFFKKAIETIDDVLKGYVDVEPAELQSAKEAISYKLLTCLKSHQKEKSTVTERELMLIIEETAKELLGSIRGDIRQLIEFTGPLNSLAKRTDFNFKEMVKAQPERLLGRDVTDCKTVAAMIEQYFAELRKRFPNASI